MLHHVIGSFPCTEEYACQIDIDNLFPVRKREFGYLFSFLLDKKGIRRDPCIVDQYVRRTVSRDIAFKKSFNTLLTAYIHDPPIDASLTLERVEVFLNHIYHERFGAKILQVYSKSLSHSSCSACYDHILTAEFHHTTSLYFIPGLGRHRPASTSPSSFCAWW